MAVLGEVALTVRVVRSEIVVSMDVANIPEGIRRLRDHKALLLRQLLDMTAVDYPDRPERFDMVYILLSVQNNIRVRIHASVSDGQTVPSITNLFLAASWYEREVWDMYGIAFAGHENLRRILTDYDFQGHPLRKDFPLTGFREMHYAPEQQAVVYDDISLPLAFRNFDFLSPWAGVLPGDEKADQGRDKP